MPDDSVEFIPGFRNEEITVFDLLSRFSGVPNVGIIKIRFHTLALIARLPPILFSNLQSTEQPIKAS